MSTERGIFPPKDADFNTYLGTVYPYINTHSARLLVSPGNLAELATQKTIWDTKYPQSQNPNTATKTIIDDKTKVRDDIEDLLRDIYDDIPKSVLTSDDRDTLNLKERKPNAPREHIITAPDITLHLLGSLQVQVQCRVVGDETRPSMHPEADVLEFRFAIGSTPPANYKLAPGVYLSTRARFTKTMEPEEAGLSLYLFCRWKNNVDESKSGPWSAMASVVIR